MVFNKINNKIKKILICFFLAAGLAELKAAENTLRFGLGLEGNMGTFMLGHSISLEFQLFKYIVNGVILTMSSDFTEKTVIEPEVFARWYFLTFNSKKAKLFLQGDLGMSILLEKSNSEPRALAGLTIGFRYLFRWGDYFIEPYLKGGYPFIVGLGIRAGCRL